MWWASIVFSFIVFFAPEGGGYFLEFNNFIPADPLRPRRTCAGVVLHPFYSIPTCGDLSAVWHRCQSSGAWWRWVLSW